MSGNNLVPASPGGLALNSLQDVLTLGKVLAESGMFRDCRTASQVVVKILAGRELGFPTVASLVGIHMIDGKPSVGSHLLAAAIRASGSYDFRILEHSNQVCAVRFRRKLPSGEWEDLEPVERLTLQEARDLGWTVNKDGTPKLPWLKTPKNMLFARCLTNGHKFHCPDLFSGLLVYDADELEPKPPAEPGPMTEHVPAGPNGQNTVTQAPAPAAEAPRPNPEPPPDLSGSPQAAGPITEADYQDLVKLAQDHRRTKEDGRLICTALGVKAFRQLPRERLAWVKEVLTWGLVPEGQADRINQLVTDLQLDWPKFRQRLWEKYRTQVVQFLLPREADQVEQSLKELKEKKAQQQPAPAITPAG